jgi:peptide/nickel transport system permease protein
MVSLRYLSRRLISFAITLLAAYTFIFFIPRIAGGDPMQPVIQNLINKGYQSEAAMAMVNEYRQMFGLTENVFVQYFKYLGNMFQGSLGLSIGFFPATVESLILKALPWTIGLLATSTILSWIIGNIFGAFIGWSGSSKINTALASIAVFFSRFPYYILAILLILVFAFYIPIFPVGGAYSMGAIPGLNLRFLLDVMYHAILPALSMILVSVGGWMLGMRSLMINIKGSDYLMFAEAKGLKRSYTLMKYAFRNALLPQVTALAMSLGYTVSGALLTESIFGYPGIGTLFAVAIGGNDYNLIQGTTILIVFSVLIANLLIDLLYPLIDPRIRYEKK